MLDGREAMRLSVSLPRRERRQITRAEVVTIVFQSTLPRRERHTSHTNTNGTTHFNPRSREGSDLHVIPLGRVQPGISIHAPAKGATAKITKTIPNDFCKINNYNNSFA